MKRIISLLLLACPVLASTAPDNDKAAERRTGTI